MRKGYQPRTCNIQDALGRMLTEKHHVVNRWREHFNQLLNVDKHSEDVEGFPVYYDVEEQLEPPTQDEVNKSVMHLKNNKAPGTDAITAELLKNGGSALYRRLFDLIKLIWVTEELPKEWHQGIIMPVFKKGDKNICSNYRDTRNYTFRCVQGVLGNLVPKDSEICRRYSWRIPVWLPTESINGGPNTPPAPNVRKRVRIRYKPTPYVCRLQTGF